MSRMFVVDVEEKRGRVGRGVRRDRILLVVDAGGEGHGSTLAGGIGSETVVVRGGVIGRAPVG